MDVEAALEQADGAPLVGAFLRHAQAAGTTIDRLASPDAALILAGRALSDLNIWQPGFPTQIGAARRAASRYRGLLEAILEQDAASWWTAPFEPDDQEWLGGADDALPAPTQPTASDSWTAYAQRPHDACFTSTTHGRLTSTLVTVALTGGPDWDPPRPLRRHRLDARPDARVIEITGPQDWHRLCRDHPAEVEADQPPCAVGTTSPDWAGVADAADLVHISLWGWMTSFLVPVEGDGIKTVLWSWDTGETTLWLRGVDLRGRSLPDLDEEALARLDPEPLAWRHAARMPPPDPTRAYVEHAAGNGEFWAVRELTREGRSQASRGEGDPDRSPPGDLRRPQRWWRRISRS